MSESNRGISPAAWGVAGAIFFVLVVGLFNQPGRLTSQRREAFDLKSCHYEEAYNAARDAEAASEKYPAGSDDPAAVEAAAKAAEAVRAQAYAEHCEQTAHDESDLNAQWRAAEASTNSANAALAAYWWVVFDLCLLIATLAAAFWAARAAQAAADVADRQFRKAESDASEAKDRITEEREATRISTLAAKAQARAHPNITGAAFTLALVEDFDKNPVVQISMDVVVANGGNTDFKSVKMRVSIWFPDNRNVYTMDRNLMDIPARSERSVDVEQSYSTLNDVAADGFKSWPSLYVDIKVYGKDVFDDPQSMDAIFDLEFEGGALEVGKTYTMIRREGGLDTEGAE